MGRMMESAQPEADGPDKVPEAPRKARQRHWLSLGLAVCIIAALVFWLDLGEIMKTLAGLAPAAVVGIVAMMMLDRVLMAWKWLLLLRAGDVHLPLGHAVRLYFQGSLSGIFMPSMVGGDLLRGYWASRATGKTHLVFASLVMEKMLGLVSAMLWSILGAVVFAVWRFPDSAWLWVGLGIAAACGVGSVFLLSLHDRVHALILKVLGRFQGLRLMGLVHKVYLAYSQFAMARSLLAWNFLLTLAEHFLQMLIVLAIAAALGIAAPPVIFLALSAAHTLLMRIPISPEGWGVGELTAIGLYGLIGIGPEAAFAVMFVFHVLVLTACLPGLVFLLQGERTPRTTT